MHEGKVQCGNHEFAESAKQVTDEDLAGTAVAQRVAPPPPLLVSTPQASCGAGGCRRRRREAVLASDPRVRPDDPC